MLLLLLFAAGVTVVASQAFQFFLLSVLGVTTSLCRDALLLGVVPPRLAAARLVRRLELAGRAPVMVRFVKVLDKRSAQVLVAASAGPSRRLGAEVELDTERLCRHLFQLFALSVFGVAKSPGSRPLGFRLIRPPTLSNPEVKIVTVDAVELGFELASFR